MTDMGTIQCKKCGTTDDNRSYRYKDGGWICMECLKSEKKDGNKGGD